MRFVVAARVLKLYISVQSYPIHLELGTVVELSMYLVSIA